jgi:hypothetical protein
MIRGLQGARPKYTINHDIPSNVPIRTIAAIDESTNTMYVEIYNDSAKAHTINLDVSAHATSGTVTYRRYADEVNDVVVGTDSLSNGVVTFTVPKSAIEQAIIPLGGGPGPTDTPGGPTDTPAPPTDTPEPCVMHVGDIAMSSQSLPGGRYKALATVTILDQADAPVGSATVSGEFTGATSDSVSDDTIGDGTVTLESSAKKNGGTWQFCVTGVAKAGCTYDEGANVETCDSVTAP